MTIRAWHAPVLALCVALAPLAACGDSGGTTTGDETSETGDETSETGDDTDETGDETSETGDETGDDTDDTGDDTDETGDDTDETGDDTDETGDDLDADDTGDDLDADDTGDDDVGPDLDADDTGDDDAGPEPDAEDPGSCSGPCDCPQGQACNDGACELGAQPVFCCDQEGCPESKVCVEPGGDLALCGVAKSSAFGEIVINEVLIDGTVDGDPNGDGDAGDGVGDEFVELRVTSDAAVDLSGFSLFDGDLAFKARHVFPDGTMAQPAQFVVVFGGGSAPDDTADALFAVANGDDLGLGLGNDGDALRLVDADGALVAVFAWGPAAPLAALSDESYTRSPDGSGDFVPHSAADGSNGALFSPGTTLDAVPGPAAD